MRTHLTFSHYSTDSYYFSQQNANKAHCLNNSSLPYHIGNLAWRRSYDDGDITPTNEIASDLNEGGGTLPRQRGAAGRNRVIERSNSATPATSMVPQTHLINSTDYVTSENAVLMSSNMRYGPTCSPLVNKKQAPEPPRRQCSIRNVKAMDTQSKPFEHNTRKYYDQHYDQVPASTRNQQYIPCTHQPIYVNYSPVQTHQTTAEIHCDKTHDTKSNSSIDSIDTIPFANENTGTIKQRLLNRQEISSSLSLSSSSSSSSTNTVANIAQSFHSIKSSSSLHEQSFHTSAETPQSPTLSSPTGKLPLNLEVRYHHNDRMEEPTATVIVSTPTDSTNVLNDIGNMLANLTDELDAMLEEEKRVGINDSE